jgi:hypothetical protein
MSRHKIIVNPIADRGAGDRAAAKIEALLGGYGLDFDIERSRCPGAQPIWHERLLPMDATALPLWTAAGVRAAAGPD